MSENAPSVTDLSLEGETLANDNLWRSTKAKQQLRDRFGRWISQGANVRFLDNGVEQAGVVSSVVGGKAYVDMKNADGTTSPRVLDPGAIRVIASKATLPPDGSKIQDAGNNFYKVMSSPEYRKALSSTGQAVITRADGYALSASTHGIDPTMTDPNNSKGNPVLYQLFAPGGRSLGTYSQGAEKDFDNMVASDKGGSSPVTEEANESPAAKAAEAPSAAPSAPAAGPVAASGDIVVTGDNSKTYRVPESVKSIISFSLKNDEALNPEDRNRAEALAYQEHVSLDEVKWIGRYFDTVSPLEQLRGGYEGRKWATKILAPSAPDLPETAEDMCHPKYMFDDDTFAYFAIGTDSGSSLVIGLLAVDYETGAVYSWTPDGFSLIPDIDMTDVDEPQIIPIDEMTADEFAHWLDSGTPGEYDVLDTDPEERNLFTLADSEIDYSELEDAFSIIAAGESYTPAERSQNAQAQGRAAGGRFGSSGGGTSKSAAAPSAKAPAQTAPANAGAPAQAPTDPNSAPAPQDSAPREKKAQLPAELPLVANPAARISEWLSTASEAPVVAAGEPAPAPDAVPVDGNPPADQDIEDSATGPTDEALYFAIVDDVDKTAVLDIVAIVKTNGQASAFTRKDGAWTADPDTLSQLQGATPPPVVELSDPETVKSVLQQIDDHDSGKDTTPAPDQAAPAAAPAPVAASGYALPDGTYTIIGVEDLQEAVVASGETPDLFVKAHIRKRARALNRMDVVPLEWRELSLAEIGELSASKCVYGEFGEIVASGIPKISDTPSDMRNVDKLKNYWKYGKGALKIRWGTPGDLTRAHRHLAKYVGPEMAWGLAQNLHKELFGVSNTTHDVATGQYVPRNRKK